MKASIALKQKNKLKQTPNFDQSAVKIKQAYFFPL